MTVHIEIQGHISTIIISRPEARNAVDGKTAKKLAAAFRSFEADDNAHVAVLYGEGGCFCAGADLKAVAANDQDLKLSEHGDGPLGPSRMLTSKPIIAAVSGHAVAGGLELALLCDLRVAEEDAVFGVFCRRWGVPLVDGGTIRLPRLIGHSNAVDMILTGRGVGASEAKTMGLANRVVANGQARQAAEALAAQIAAFPQQCMRHDRLSAYQQWDLSFEEALANEYDHGRQVLESHETVVGAQRFSDGAGRHGSFDDN
jgi:enoyl-CoA hydratase